MLIIYTLMDIFKALITASATLHNRSLEKVMGASMQFFDSNPSGRIINRFSRDLDEGKYIVNY